MSKIKRVTVFNEHRPNAATVRNYRYCYRSSELTVRPKSTPLLPANISICDVNSGLFAGKPAPTGICTDHKALLQRRNLWDRASSRRLTKEQHQTFRQKKPAAPVQPGRRVLSFQPSVQTVSTFSE
jgi:hypothetical protein